MHDERRLYQQNLLGYRFILLFILLNTIYSISMLNNMEINFYIGIFIIGTLILTLVCFLVAVKAKNYSILWSYISIGIGILKILIYIFGRKNLLSSGLNLFNQTVLLIGIGCMIIGGTISLIVSIKRANYIAKHGIVKSANSIGE